MELKKHKTQKNAKLVKYLKNKKKGRGKFLYTAKKHKRLKRYVNMTKQKTKKKGNKQMG